jgi:hypothetical protein
MFLEAETGSGFTAAGRNEVPVAALGKFLEAEVGSGLLFTGRKALEVAAEEVLTGVGISCLSSIRRNAVGAEIGELLGIVAVVSVLTPTGRRSGELITGGFFGGGGKAVVVSFLSFIGRKPGKLITGGFLGGRGTVAISFLSFTGRNVAELAVDEFFEVVDVSTGCCFLITFD